MSTVQKFENKFVPVPVTGPDSKRTGLISTVMLVVVVSCCITRGRGGLVGLESTVQDSYIVGKPCPLPVTAARVNLKGQDRCIDFVYIVSLIECQGRIINDCGGGAKLKKKSLQL